MRLWYLLHREPVKNKNSSLIGYLPVHARIQKVGQGVQTPLKNNKNIGFYGNIGPDPLKITARFDVGPLSTRQGNAI